MIKTTLSITNVTKCCKANFWLFLVLIAFKVNAQVPPMQVQTYSLLYANTAITQMMEYKIPASVILAQAIFESNSGNSALAKKSNNHFGIKCHLDWEGDTITSTDDTLNECFRKYSNVEDSYIDHSLFLTIRNRYAPLFNLKITDYKGWCYGLKNAGYATYYNYAEELIKIIETHKLYQLDRVESMEMAVNKDLTDYSLNKNYGIDIFNMYDKNCNLNLLFSNEKDVLIQNINMLINQFEDKTETSVVTN